MSHTHEEWIESNLNHYQSAHSSRTKSERIRNEADTLIANCSSKTQRSQQEASTRLGSRIEDCNSWRADLQTELDNNIRENGLLKETKSELEHAIAETERPLRINNECVKNREARIGIDLVKDEVENSLEREVENIKTYQQRMQKMLARVNQQIETNHSMQDKLHADLEHKDMALEIDRDCHELHNDAIDIKHHDGIEEEDVSGSVPQSWAKFSKNNVEESQSGRAGTRQLRYDVNNLINNAASDMSVHWNKTNRAFTDRISECQDAHRNLKSNLILTKNEIADMERYIERVKKSISSKEPPLKVAETRLSKRTKRPEVEACNDQPHGKLTDEVKELKQSIKDLEIKLKESDDSLAELQNIKTKLESDIKVKNNSLLIDQQKCMSMRRTLPYNIVATRQCWRQFCNYCDVLKLF